VAQNPSLSSLAGIGRLTELRQRLFFTLGALLVFRFGVFIAVPGVDPEAMLLVMESQRGTVVDMLNMFSGGALERFSLFALGVMPYITASIVIQLAATSVPALQALRKEGESGRRKMNQYTRYFTVVLAMVQAFGAATMLQAQTSGAGIPVVVNPGWGFVLTAVISLTAGTMFVMWLGEQITERGLGNGISLIIFAGIVASLPGAIASTLAAAGQGNIEPLVLIILAIVIFGTVAFVVFMERAQRRISVNYAKRGGGRMAYQNVSSHLPLKINMAGVIPAIFASSFILFPATLLQFWGGDQSQVSWLTRASAMLSPGQPLYMITEAVLIVGFAFFYTALVFDSKETADNLKKSGALIPGIRPGRATADYIDGVMTRLTMIGGLYLTAVCLLPHILQNSLNLTFFFGGTSLLIVVVVVIDTMAQVQTHLVSHQYDSLLKKANLKGLTRSGVMK